ncbi:MAG: YaaA family protein [Epsilonproteobacteria bacterium]|nr:YaaA family protein [Campylobacterota bacterium]
MKILLAPSERKSLGGDKNFNISSFTQLNPLREEAIKKYDEFILKTDDYKNFGDDKTPIKNRPAKEAILRYTGVAFEYLDYNSLPQDAKDYLNENLIIFSNLFGILKPLDFIPYYTLKQGAKPGFDIYKHYKEKVTEILDSYDTEYIDLRAKFYEKIYKPKNAVTFKFIKNGKVVSHFAKAYRGTLTRHIALAKPNSIKEVLKIDFPGIKITEIQEKKGIKEIVCEIS